MASNLTDLADRHMISMEDDDLSRRSSRVTIDDSSRRSSHSNRRSIRAETHLSVDDIRGSRNNHRSSVTKAGMMIAGAVAAGHRRKSAANVALLPQLKPKSMRSTLKAAEPVSTKAATVPGKPSVDAATALEHLELGQKLTSALREHRKEAGKGKVPTVRLEENSRRGSCPLSDRGGPSPREISRASRTGFVTEETDSDETTDSDDDNSSSSAPPPREARVEADQPAPPRTCTRRGTSQNRRRASRKSRATSASRWSARWCYSSTRTSASTTSVGACYAVRWCTGVARDRPHRKRAPEPRRATSEGWTI